MNTSLGCHGFSEHLRSPLSGVLGVEVVDAGPTAPNGSREQPRMHFVSVRFGHFVCW